MSASPWMTERPRATHSLTPRCDSSRPRPSTCFSLSSISSSTPSPLPTSSTFAPGGMRSATTWRSTRWLPLTLIGPPAPWRAPPSAGTRRSRRTVPAHRAGRHHGRDPSRSRQRRLRRRRHSAHARSRRFSSVGNSQSLVKETRQKRVFVPVNASRQASAMVGGEVEIIHRAGEVEIGIGVEAVDESHALMAQIALDLEIGVEPEGQGARGPAGCARTCGAGPLRRDR